MPKDVSKETPLDLTKVDLKSSEGLLQTAERIAAGILNGTIDVSRASACLKAIHAVQQLAKLRFDYQKFVAGHKHGGNLKSIALLE